MKIQLSQSDRELIAKMVVEGKTLPLDLKYTLFPTEQKEYELIYSGKMRKEDILANEDGVYPVPLQVDKIYSSTKRLESHEDWENIVVFGDNLQLLKTIYADEDPLILRKIKGKVKLIYIDPPFASEADFKGNKGQKAYADKVKGAEFSEFLRRRLILAKEILADDGVLCVHLDTKKAHYIKILLDELFSETRFVNEIIWSYKSGGAGKSSFAKKHDTLLIYSKSDNYTFNMIKEKSYNRDFKPYRFKEVEEYKDEIGWYTLVNMRDVWDIDMVGRTSSERMGYPTQKPERLLERIIKAFTDKGDLVMDFFAGSGTTAIVAEKMYRRWIVCDIGKYSYYTIQKRLLSINTSTNSIVDTNASTKNYVPFITAQQGLYHLDKVFEMQEEKYKKFVMELFEIEDKKHKIFGIEFDGKKGEGPVKIYPHWKEGFNQAAIDEEYLENIHLSIGKKELTRVYIIAPANYFDFITDYYEIEYTKYYFLKIPYQVIKELHRVPFQKLRQPQSKNNVNYLDEAVGFHFVRQPEVKSSITPKDNVLEIEITEFRSQCFRSMEEGESGKFDTLAMVLIDTDYNEEEFLMEKVYFADELLSTYIEVDECDANEGLVAQAQIHILLNKNEIGNKLMVIYVDIYGNEFREKFVIKEENIDGRNKNI